MGSEIQSTEPEAAPIVENDSSVDKLEHDIILLWSIRESVDSLCRDGADTPRPPYIGNTCTRPNAMFVSLFSRLTLVLKCFCT